MCFAKFCIFFFWQISVFYEMISSILTGSKTKLSRLMLETVQWCSLAERDDETLLVTSQFVSDKSF